MIEMNKKEWKSFYKQLDIDKKFGYIQGDYDNKCIFKVGDNIGIIKYKDGCFYPFLYWLNENQYSAYLQGNHFLNNPMMSMGIFQ